MQPCEMRSFFCISVCTNFKKQTPPVVCCMVLVVFRHAARLICGTLGKTLRDRCSVIASEIKRQRYFF